MVWYIVTEMAIDEYSGDNTPERENNNGKEQSVPVGIARIRDEWRAAGLIEQREATEAPQGPEPVIFPEVDGGAGVGDYTLDEDAVRNRLALSEDAIDRLISSGELDSLLVQGAEATARRLFSEASVSRFLTDSAIDPEAIRRAAKAMADQTVAESIQQLQGEIEELRNAQGRVLQQMKDVLLLEIRNLKEQDRDLTSFVYELAEEIKERMPRKKK